jgi:uncharacterized protein (TIGR02145 family)
MKRKTIVTLVLLFLIGLSCAAAWHFFLNSKPSANSDIAIKTAPRSKPTTPLSNTTGKSPVLGKEISGLPEYCADKLISVSGCDGMTETTSEQGNTYQLVEIGDQCWFADNLKEIPTTDQGWYGYYENAQKEPAPGEGMLYTWSAAMNDEETELAQGVCPAGWHIPSICNLLYSTNAAPSGDRYFELTGYWSVSAEAKNVFARSGKMRSWRGANRELVFADGEGERFWTSTQSAPLGLSKFPISTWFMKPRVLGDLRTVSSDSLIALPVKCTRNLVSL